MKRETTDLAKMGGSWLIFLLRGGPSVFSGGVKSMRKLRPCRMDDFVRPATEMTYSENISWVTDRICSQRGMLSSHSQSAMRWQRWRIEWRESASSSGMGLPRKRLVFFRCIDLIARGLRASSPSSTLHISSSLTWRFGTCMFFAVNLSLPKSTSWKLMRA